MKRSILVSALLVTPVLASAQTYYTSPYQQFQYGYRTYVAQPVYQGAQNYGHQAYQVVQNYGQQAYQVYQPYRPYVESFGNASRAVMYSAPVMIMVNPQHGYYYSNPNIYRR